MLHCLRPLALVGAALLTTAATQPRESQQTAPAAASAWTYADIADLALTAPVTAQVELRRAIPLRSGETVGVPAGYSRFYIEADVIALVRGEPGMPAQVRYLADFPNDARGRPVRPTRRTQWLIFASAVRGRPGELQLLAPDALIPFSPEVAQRAREILRASLEQSAPPVIVGIGRAFHVPGALPGTSETQIFLQTAQNQPVSITVTREAGREPRWFVSLSEFVDAGAAQPQRDTLLWYRLACSLPPQLPAASTADASEHGAAITADYRVVRQGLGPCQRTRVRR